MKGNIKRNCLQCNKEFFTQQHYINKGMGKFCSRSCGVTHQNLNRPLTKVTCLSCNKEFDSKSPKTKYCKESCKNKIKISINKINPTMGRTNLSKKIIRLGATHDILYKCFNCGWDKCVCDIHNIKPKCDGGSDELNNLIILCPNCHRLAHKDLIKCVISISDKIKDSKH